MKGEKTFESLDAFDVVRGEIQMGQIVQSGQAGDLLDLVRMEVDRQESAMEGDLVDVRDAMAHQTQIFARRTTRHRPRLRRGRSLEEFCRQLRS